MKNTSTLPSLMRKHVPATLSVALLLSAFAACNSQTVVPDATNTSSSQQQPLSSSDAMISSSISSLATTSPSSHSSSSIVSWVKSSAERKNRVQPAFSNANDVWRGNFPVTRIGKRVLSEFLTKAGLPEIASLHVGGGTSALTSDICNKLFGKYQVIAKTNANAGRCTNNLLGDGTFADSDPIIISLSEFDGKYLLLIVDEEGLGAAKMFSYVYSIETGDFSVIHRTKFGDTYIYYSDFVLYFVAPDGKLTYTYDLEREELVKR